MNIYLIQRRNPRVDADEHFQMTVLADCETEVRRLASEAASSEGPMVWMSPTSSRVVYLGTASAGEINIADPDHGGLPVKFKQVVMTG